MSTDTNNLVVRQSNELIEASYKIASIGEGRLMRMLIAQISPSDEDFKTYRISVSDFASFFNITHNSVHEQIEQAARALREREVLIRKGKSWFSTGWLSSAEYIEGTGYVEVSIHARLKPYLLGLKSYFTQYELEKIVNFKSGYAMRLFELLKKEQFKAGKGGSFTRVFEYEELRELLGVGKKEYEFFKDFRVRAIDIAVREINANPDIYIARVDYKKTGRKVSHIVFQCERPRQLQLNVHEPLPRFEEVAKESEIPEDVRDLVAMGIDESTAYKWRKKYGVKRLTRNLAYTRAMQKAGKIRDSLTGFLARAIADNLGSTWEEEHKAKQEAHKAHEDAQAAKEALERKKSEEQRAWIESTLATFNALSDDRKTELRSAYADTLSDITRKSFDKQGEHAPMHRMKFAKFFEEQGMK
jgi:plasmid replication initiation protein